jgi:hypothetical protein
VLVTTFIAPPVLRQLLTRVPPAEMTTDAGQSAVSEMMTEA